MDEVFAGNSYFTLVPEELMDASLFSERIKLDVSEVGFRLFGRSRSLRYCVDIFATTEPKPVDCLLIAKSSLARTAV